jgi:adenine phosphoribosyltransferase
VVDFSLTQADMDALKAKIRHVPDFPKAGILFYDITTLLRDPAGFKLAIDSLALPYSDRNVEVVVGIESRGFILGAAVADRLGAGFTPIRKPGKLPAKTMKESFQLEYGTDSLEMHEDAIQAGQRVLIVDDVLATGGTAAAASSLVRRCGGDLLGLAFLIELTALNGRSKLENESVYAVLKY